MKLTRKLKIVLGNQLRNQKLSKLERTAYKNFRCSKESDKPKVLIFAQGRTGSTLLESLIDSSGNFESYGEAISKANTPKGRKLRSCFEYLEGLSRIDPDKGTLCHVKIYQITDHQNEDPGELIQRLSEGWKIIYLYRSNVVDHALSSIIAEARNSYEVTDSKFKLEKVTIDIPYFESLVNGRILYAKQERAALKGLDFLPLNYENDLKDQNSHQTTISKICQFLIIESFKGESIYRKINDKSWAELIINYSEFLECIRRNGYSEYLDEPESLKSFYALNPKGFAGRHVDNPSDYYKSETASEVIPVCVMQSEPERIAKMS